MVCGKGLLASLALLVAASLLLAAPASQAAGPYKLGVGVGYTVTYKVTAGKVASFLTTCTYTYKVLEVKTTTYTGQGVSMTYEYAVCELTIKGLGKKATQTVELEEGGMGPLFMRIFYPVDEDYWSDVERMLINLTGELTEAAYTFEVEGDVVHYSLTFKDPATGKMSGWDEKVRLSDGIMIHLEIITEGQTVAVFELGKAGPAIPWFVWPAAGVGVAAVVLLVLWKKGLILKPKGLPPPP